MARIRTYKAANGCNEVINSPAFARVAKIIENSPREIIVRPIFREALWERLTFLPVQTPDIILPQRVKMTAVRAGQTAPPKVKRSMLRPKLKKKRAPKKSLKGTNRAALLLLFAYIILVFLSTIIRHSSPSNNMDN
jgi:hypothetical protein